MLCFGGECYRIPCSEFLEHLASDNGADMHKYNTLYTRTLNQHVLTLISLYMIFWVPHRKSHYNSFILSRQLLLFFHKQLPFSKRVFLADLISQTGISCFVSLLFLIFTPQNNCRWFWWYTPLQWMTGTWSAKSGTDCIPPEKETKWQ